MIKRLTSTNNILAELNVAKTSWPIVSKNVITLLDLTNSDIITTNNNRFSKGNTVFTPIPIQIFCPGMGVLCGFYLFEGHVKVPLP